MSQVSGSSTPTNLFPAAVRFAASFAPPTVTALFPAEQAHSADMAPGRALQFSHGRQCARDALAALGVEPCGISVGAEREPLWPAGITGSITHCEHRAAAAVAFTRDISGVGLDLEEQGRLTADIGDMICTPRERIQLSGLPGTYGKLLFSAKESVFKCIWPSVRRYVDFLEIGIDIDIAEGSFQTTSRDRTLGTMVDRIEGRFCQSDGAWLTAAWICAKRG
jgi:4'-phosphopantetheinyl transferase EntD